MIHKNQYVIQPYPVGPKDRKSLVMSIPAAIAKKYKIDRNTIFILKAEMINNKLILEKIIDKDDNNNKRIVRNIDLLSVDSSSEGSSQQITNRVR